MPSQVQRLYDLQVSLDVDLMQFCQLPDQGIYLREENRKFLWGNGYHWAISLALHISASVCDLLHRHNDEGLMWYFHSHCVGRADQLELSAQKLAVLIDSMGYRAFVVPGKKRGYSDGNPGILSHQAIGRLSGMGTIGDNGLLVTTKYGPRVRLSTIVTTMPLPGQFDSVQDNCLHCGDCVAACPSGALDGHSFDLHDPVAPMVNKQCCGTYRNGRLDRLGTKFCNLCMAVCPVGLKDGHGI
jgi:Uncharacterized Fe-S protein